MADLLCTILFIGLILTCGSFISQRCHRHECVKCCANAVLVESLRQLHKSKKGAPDCCLGDLKRKSKKSNSFKSSSFKLLKEYMSDEDISRMLKKRSSFGESKESINKQCCKKYSRCGDCCSRKCCQLKRRPPQPSTPCKSPTPSKSPSKSPPPCKLPATSTKECFEPPPPPICPKESASKETLTDHPNPDDDLLLRQAISNVFDDGDGSNNSNQSSSGSSIESKTPCGQKPSSFECSKECCKRNAPEGARKNVPPSSGNKKIACKCQKACCKQSPCNPSRDNLPVPYDGSKGTGSTPSKPPPRPQPKSEKCLPEIPLCPHPEIPPCPYPEIRPCLPPKLLPPHPPTKPSKLPQKHKKPCRSSKPCCSKCTARCSRYKPITGEIIKKIREAINNPVAPEPIPEREKICYTPCTGCQSNKQSKPSNCDCAKERQAKERQERLSAPYRCVSPLTTNNKKFLLQSPYSEDVGRLLDMNTISASGNRHYRDNNMSETCFGNNYRKCSGRCSLWDSNHTTALAQSKEFCEINNTTLETPMNICENNHKLPVELTKLFSRDNKTLHRPYMLETDTGISLKPSKDISDNNTLITTKLFENYDAASLESVSIENLEIETSTENVSDDNVTLKNTSIESIPNFVDVDNLLHNVSIVNDTLN